MVNDDQLCLEQLRLTQTVDAPPVKVPTAQAVRYFIRGPIDLQWIKSVCMLPGGSPLRVALAICFQAGLQKSKTDVRVCWRHAEQFGVQRRTFHDAIKLLEEASLIQVCRKPGRCLRITLLDGLD